MSSSRRLRRRGHLTEVEQHGDQRARVGVDLVGEVGQDRALADPDDGRAVAAGDADAADRRGLHLLELLALRALGLAAAAGTTATAAEGTLGASHDRRGPPRNRRRTATGTTAEAAAATGATAGRDRTGTATRTAAPPDAAGALTGTGDRRCGRASCPGSGRAPPGRGPAAPAPAPPARAGTGARTALRTRHALARGERVVAGRGRGARASGPCPGSGRTGCCPGAACRAGRGAGRGPAWPEPPSRRGGRGRCRGGGSGRRGGRRSRSGRGRPGSRRRVRGADGRGRRRAGAAGAAGAGAHGAGSGRGEQPRAPTGAAGGGCRRRQGRPEPRPPGRPLGGGLLGAAERPAPRPWGASAGNVSRNLRTTGGSIVDDRRSDELAELVRGLEEDLALDSELLGELVYPDLSHFSPVSGPAAGTGRTVVTAGGCSSLSTHRVLISVSTRFRFVAARTVARRDRAPDPSRRRAVWSRLARSC